METVLTKDLIRTVAKETGFSQDKVKFIIDTTFSTIGDIMVRDGKVRVNGFGTFSLCECKERNGYNPSTKENITIPAYKRAHFSTSDTLKAAIKAGGN